MIRIRHLLQQGRRPVLALAALALVCLALIAAHSAAGGIHMEGDPGDEQMAPIFVAICLAIVEGALTLAVVWGGAVALAGRRRPFRSAGRTNWCEFHSMRAETSLARAGPARLQVFLR